MPEFARYRNGAELSFIQVEGNHVTIERRFAQNEWFITSTGGSDANKEAEK